MENKPKHLSYAAIILLAFLNAVLLFPFLYYYLGGLILGNSGGKLLLYVFPVAVAADNVPGNAVIAPGVNLWRYLEIKSVCQASQQRKQGN